MLHVTKDTIERIGMSILNHLIKDPLTFHYLTLLILSSGRLQSEEYQRNIKHLLNEKEPPNLILNEVEFLKCFIIPTRTSTISFLLAVPFLEHEAILSSTFYRRLCVLGIYHSLPFSAFNMLSTGISCLDGVSTEHVISTHSSRDLLLHVRSQDICAWQWFVATWLVFEGRT